MKSVRQRQRVPGAFAIDDPSIEPLETDVLEALDPVEADTQQALETIVHPPRRGIRFGTLAAATGGAIVSLAIAVAFDALIRDLFARAAWLGWLGLGLVALFVVALLGLVGRELLGLLRLKRLARLRLASDAAAASGDRDEAVAALTAVLALYRDRADLARARRLVAAQLTEIMDGRDLMVLAERDLVAPLDRRAKALASAAARRVSVVTAVSPRAVFDVAFVLFESVRLIRRIAAVYGGRPGTLGLFRLMRAVLGHLAVTGSIAVGDTILQQFVGHGIAGRLSAKLGEGVVNGLMTARIGLSAMDVCRPLPFLAAERPRLKDLAGNLVSVGETPADAAATKR